MQKSAIIVISAILIITGFGYAIAESYIIVAEDAGQTTNPILVETSDGTDRMTVDPDGDIWSDQNIAFDSGTAFTGTFDHVLTADRTFTFPDLTGTIALLTGTQTFTGKTIDDDDNTIIDLAVTALKDGTDGELITWSNLGVAETVAVGTATHVLTSNGIGLAPTFQASAGGGGFTSVLKTSDESTDTDIILSDDSELSFDVDANGTYLVFSNLLVVSHATPDFKYAYSAPSGSIGRIGAGEWNSADNTQTTVADILTAHILLIAGTTEVGIQGISILDIGGTAGTVNLQWAQRISDANPTTMKAGSSILWMKLN